MTPEVQRLERLAERLRAIDPYVPPPEAKIRGWNLVLAAVEQSTSARSRIHPYRRLIIATAAAALLVLAGAGAAAADSLPDSPLYPLKGVIEGARGALTFSAGDKLAYHIDLARTRLTEAGTMIGRHRPDLAGASLKALDDQLTSAALLVQAQRQANPAAAARFEDRLRQAVATADQQLADLQGQVKTPSAAGAIAEARAHAADALKLAQAPAATPQSSPSGSARPSPSPSDASGSPTATP